VLNELDSTSADSSLRPGAADFAAIFLLDSAGRITFANAAARTLWQADSAGLTGHSFCTLFSFEMVSARPGWLEAQWQIVLGTALGTGTILSAQPRVGPPREVRVRIEKVSDGAYLATVQSPLAPAGAALNDAGGLSLLAKQGAAGFFDLDLKSGRVTYSPSWKKILGYADGELSDTLDTWRELIHPDDSGAAPDQLGKKLHPGTHPFGVEYRMRHRRGHWVWIQCIGIRIFNSTGELERVVGLNLDISDRKEFDEASLVNAERLEFLAGIGPLGAFDLDFASQVFWFSPGWKKILRYRDDEPADDSASFVAALPPDERDGGADTWFLLRAPGRTAFVESTDLIAKDGERIPVILGAHRTLTRKRELVRVVGFICPASRGRSGTPVDEDGLSSALVKDAFASVAEGVLIADPVGKILHANPAASRLLAQKPEQIIGLPVTDVFRLVYRENGRPGDDPCHRALTAEQPLPLFNEHALLPVNGAAEPRPIIWTARASLDEGVARGVVIVFRDPAEMSLTPEELVKANRFESLGLLAGGISHDFNNILTTILGGISLAKDTHNFSGLDDAEKGCLTAKGLTKQLLMFAKGGSGTQVVVGARDLFDDAVKIAAAGADAEIVIDAPDGVQPVSVDRAQMLQVFQNLIVNALQAMPPPPHRAQVHLRASNVALTAEQIPPLPEGNYVEFEVRDNGSGIAPENLQKIFDPFFTTKKHGTGLGLATVFSIVRKHGGQIGVDSTSGQGTAFTVFLPRADAPVEVQVRRAPSLRFGTGRILFMDDDPKISALSASMLQSLDYKFDLAKNGDDAIQFYKRYLNIGRPYDAVILDITVIGGMGGEECFKTLRDLDPDVRAIVSSGYDNEDMARRFIDLGFCAYLTKPYRVHDLGKVLRAVLG